MEQLRRAMASIRAAAVRLDATQKLLIASVCVVLLMTLFLVQLYAGRRDMVPLMPGATPEQQTRMVAYLQTSAVPYEDRGGQILVPASQHRLVLAQLAQSNALPADSRVLFDNLIDKQSWTLSQRQNQQLETIAVQNELAGIISKMNGIRSASVILNIPERRGMGQPATPPSASATVFPVRSLDQHTVDSIAHLVAGSRGIDPRHVRVIDGSTNRQHRAREESGMAASTYLEYVAAVEARKQEQISEMLSAYIPGVIVTVHAQVDVTRRRTETKSVLPEGKGSATLLTGEQTSTREDRQRAIGGEPGPRSNTREDILSAFASDAGGSRETTSDSQFTGEFGREVRVIDDPRGHPTKINAVVNIPRPYFVEVWRLQRPGPQGDADPVEPTEAELAPLVESETARIRREVELQIDTSAGDGTVKGEVQVSMIPVAGPFPSQNGAAQPAALFGVPTGTLALDGLVKSLALGALAVVALGMVAVTAMRATRREPLPSAAELVGVPPALEGAEDLIGEATEADSALQGIELTDDEMRTRKVTEQVADLVKERPQDAARLLGRWITGS